MPGDDCNERLQWALVWLAVPVYALSILYSLLLPVLHVSTIPWSQLPLLPFILTVLYLGALCGVLSAAPAVHGVRQMSGYIFSSAALGNGLDSWVTEIEELYLAVKRRQWVQHVLRAVRYRSAECDNGGGGGGGSRGSRGSSGVRSLPPELIGIVLSYLPSEHTRPHHLRSMDDLTRALAPLTPRPNPSPAVSPSITAAVRQRYLQWLHVRINEMRAERERFDDIERLLLTPARTQALLAQFQRECQAEEESVSRPHVHSDARIDLVSGSADVRHFSAAGTAVPSESEHVSPIEPELKTDVRQPLATAAAAGAEIVVQLPSPHSRSDRDHKWTGAGPQPVPIQIDAGSQHVLPERESISPVNRSLNTLVLPPPASHDPRVDTSTDDKSSLL
jgi:hypothetical protein